MPPKSPAPKRIRRDPEEARQHILAAAEAVLAAKGPDATGLKDVARAAGVSHALVSHYFGSYESLVDAVLAKRVARMRDVAIAELVSATTDKPGAVIDRLAAFVEDEQTTRLAGWALLTGRAKRGEFFSARVQGMKLATDALAMKRKQAGLPAVPRADLEFAVVATITMVLGFGIAKDAILAGLGVASDAASRKRAGEEYRARVASMIERYLADTSQSSGRR